MLGAVGRSTVIWLLYLAPASARRGSCARQARRLRPRPGFSTASGRPSGPGTTVAGPRKPTSTGSGNSSSSTTHGTLPRWPGRDLGVPVLSRRAGQGRRVHPEPGTRRPAHSASRCAPASACWNCCRLRVKDVDFATKQIVIRDGKGRKDLVTMLPAAVRPMRGTHLDVTGERRRHHLHESVLQRAVKEAVRAAGIPKPATCQTSATPSPPTCWRTTRTSGPSWSSSVTGCQRHDDLHACPRSGPGRRPEPGRTYVPVVT